MSHLPPHVAPKPYGCYNQAVFGCWLTIAPFVVGAPLAAIAGLLVLTGGPLMLFVVLATIILPGSLIVVVTACLAPLASAYEHRVRAALIRFAILAGVVLLWGSAIALSSHGNRGKIAENIIVTGAPTLRQYAADHKELPDNPYIILPWYLRLASHAALDVRSYGNKISYSPWSRDEALSNSAYREFNLETGVWEWKGGG